MSTDNKKIKVGVGFEVEKIDFSTVSSQLRQIQRDAQEPGNAMNESFQKAATTAKQLENIINQSFNKDLGTTNIKRFNDLLVKSNITMKEIQSSFSVLGTKGAAAYNKLGSAILNTNIKLKEGNKLLNEMAATMSNTVKWGTSSVIFKSVTDAIRGAYDYSVKLNQSLNDIRIVTGKSSEEMSAFAKEANSAAKALGASTMDVTKSSLIYYQAGLSDTEVQARSEITTKVANVTGQAASDASEQLTAIWNGYKVSAAEAELYIDKVAKVAATTAADLEEMATGMSKVASAANSAGVDIDQLNGILSTVISVTREAPETVGSSFKTIFARLGDLELNGQDEYGVSLGKVSSQMEGLGIQILDQQGQMRDMGDIIEDTAAKWQTWTSAQKQAAAIAMAGKMQYSRLIALFDNWNMYEKAVSDSQSAVGTLQEQQDIYLESIPAKINKLKATYEDLYGSIFQDDEIGSFTDALRNAVQVLDNFFDSFGGGIKSITAFGAVISNVFNKQITQGIIEADRKRKQFQSNIELVSKQKQAVQEGVAKSGKNATAGDIATEAGYAKQLEYAKEIQSIQGKISEEEFQELMTLQKRAGEIQKEITYQEQLAIEKAKGVGLTEEDLANIQDVDMELSNQVDKLEEIIEKRKNISTSTTDWSDIVDVMSENMGSYNERNDYYQNISKLEKDIKDSIKDEVLSSKDYEDVLKRITNIKKRILNYNKDSDKNGKRAIDIQKQLEAILKSIKEKEEQLNLEDKERIKNLEKQLKVTGELIKKEDELGGLKTEGSYVDADFSARIDQGKNAVDIAQKVTAATSSLSSFVMAWSSVDSMFQTWTDDTSTFGDKIEQTLLTGTMAIGTFVSSLSNLNEVMGLWSTSSEIATAKQTLANISKQLGVTVTKNMSIAEIEELAAKKGVTVATEEATAAQTVLNTTMKANPVFWLITGITALIGVISIWSSIEKQRAEEEKKNNEELIKKSEALETEKNAVNDLKNAYDSALSVYKITNDSKEELEKTTEELAKKLGIEGEMIGSVEEQYDSLLKKMKKVAEAQLKTDKEGLSGAEKNAYNNLKGEKTFNLITGQESKRISFTPSDIWIGATDTDKEIQNILADYYKQEGVDYSQFDSDSNMTKAIISSEQDFKKLYETTKKAHKEKISSLWTENASADESVVKWLKDNEEAYNQIIERENAINEDILQIAYSKQNLEEEIKSIDVTSLDKYEEYKEQYKKTLEQTFVDNGIERSQEEILKLTEEYLSKNTTFNKYQLAEDKRDELLKKFGEAGRDNIQEQILGLSYDELEIFVTFSVDEMTSDENIKNYIDRAKAQAKYNSSSALYTAADNVSDTLLSGKKYEDLNKDQLESVKVLEKEYQDLANILDKNSNRYLEKLIQIREEQEKNAAAAKQTIENTLIDDIQKLDENGKKILDPELDTDKLQKQLNDIANADYSVLVELKTDAQSDFDDIIQVMDNMETMASKIGDDFIIAASDIEELGNTFPGILENMELLSDGSAKLAEDSVKNSMIAAQAEVDNSTEATVKQLQLKQQEMEGKEVAARQIAEIAQKQAAQEGEAAKLSSEDQSTINKALNTLKQDNAEKTANYEKDEEKDIAETAKINAEAMANNFTDAYSKMTEDSAKWATAAKSNLIAGSTGQGEIKSPSFTSFKATNGGGTVTTAKKGELTSEVNAETKTNWSDVANYYNQLADAYQKASGNIENKIGEIYARQNKLNTSTGNISRGLGSDGKSGSGSKKEQDSIDLIDSELNRYHDVDIQLKEISNDLDVLQSQKDKLFGKDLIENLNKQIALLQKQVDKTKEKIQIAKGEAAEVRNELSGYGVQFNANGDISNYNEVYQAQLNYVNGLINAYNNMSVEQQETAKETIEQAKEDFNNFVDKISTYDEIITDKIPSLEKEIQDAIDQEVEINISKFNMEIEIRLDMSSAERDWNKFKKEVIDDIKDDDILGNAKAQLEDFYSYYKDGEKGIIQTNTKHVNEIIDQLKQIEQTGTSSIYGNNQAQALEDLKTYYEQLMKDLEDVDSLVEEIKESYLNMMDEAKNKFKEQISLYETLSDTIKHDMKVIQLVYGEDSYKELSLYYEKQEENYNNQLTFQRQEVEFWKQQMDVLEEGSSQWEAAKNNWLDAVNQWQSSVESAIENLQDKYANTIEGIFQNLNDQVTNGKGLEYVNQQWDLINKKAEQYLDDINATYGIQQLQEKYLKSIDELDSVGAERELQKIMEQEVSALREKDKLTKYDLERAELKYQIALKQIALQEAQQNKSTMRLKRDSQGNYSYQFGADANEVSSLQEEISNLYNQLYNLDSNKYKDNLNSMYDIWAEFQQKLLEAEKINDPEKKRQAELLLWEEYGDLINGVIEENEVIKNNLYESTFLELSDLYDTNMEEFTEMTKEEKDILMDKMIPYWNSGIQEMTDTFAGNGGFTETCNGALEDLHNATTDYEESIKELEKSSGVTFNQIKNGTDNATNSINKLIAANNGLIKGNSDLINKYKEELTAVNNVIKQIETLTTKYNSAKNSAVAATEAAYKYWKQEQEIAAEKVRQEQEEQQRKASQQTQQQSQQSVQQSQQVSQQTQQAPSLNIGSYVEVKSNRRWYYDSYGTNPSGSARSGTIKYINTRSGATHPYNIDGLGWIKKEDIVGYDTGGYTGSWGSDGRMAFLHQKELVLNAKDTENFLNAINSMRTLTGTIGTDLLQKLANMNNLTGFVTSSIGGDQLEQNVHIEASFPNVTKHDEIEQALLNLNNIASMHIRK